METLAEPPRTILKTTKSRCPVCQEEAPASVWASDGDPRVMLSRICATHGEISNCISSDSRFFWLSKGDPGNSSACCAGSSGSDGFLGSNAFPDKGATCETLSTCLALIEIVDSCNLRCPTCYANSPHGVGAALDSTPMDRLQARIQSAIDRKGRLEILQLSGGEPTLHPQFFEILEWCMRHEKIDYVLINTNGIRLAAEKDFASRLKETFKYGKTQLYLQFDGVQESGQVELRGIDLRQTKKKALQNAQAIDLPVTLAMTVTKDNVGSLWDAVRFGLKFDNVRGISFQPMFFNGRIPPNQGQLQQLLDSRLNTADVILGVVEQSKGKVKFEDFTPLPCGDPNCATIGYLIKFGGAVRSVSDFIDFKEIQGFLKDRIRYDINDLSQCGCESEPLGALLQKFEINEKHTFRLFIKPFMDALSWDEDRIDRCCTHVIRPDGQLDSFCRYYSNLAAETPAAVEMETSCCAG